MIKASVTPDAKGFAGRLAAGAATLAKAHGESLLRARRNDATRWRSARLLWPLFTKD